MDHATFRQFVRADLWREAGRWSTGMFLKAVLLHAGFKIVFWTRLCAYLHGKAFPWSLLFVVARVVQWRLSRKVGVALSYRCRVGPGLLLSHPTGIVVNEGAVIGANCDLSQHVTIGRSNRGQRAGIPKIGNDVYIGPGAVIFGNVTVGDGAAIGANAVVTRDVPASGVAVGVPARIVSQSGSAGYINRTDY